MTRDSVSEREKNKTAACVVASVFLLLTILKFSPAFGFGHANYDSVPPRTNGWKPLTETTVPDDGIRHYTATHPPFWLWAPKPNEDVVIGALLTKRKFISPKLTVLFKTVLGEKCKKEPDTRVWDIGANTGYFALYAAAMGCRALAVEPNPRLARMIEQSARDNGWQDRVTVLQAAVADSEAEYLWFRFPPHREWGMAQVFTRGPGVRVPVIRMDELWCPDTPDPPPFLIKVDMEGAEEMLEKSGSDVLNATTHLFVEVWQQASPVCTAFSEHFGHTRGFKEDYGLETPPPEEAADDFTFDVPHGTCVGPLNAEDWWFYDTDV